MPAHVLLLSFSGAPSRLVNVILGGKLDALRHDLPELPELDNLFAPEVWECSVFYEGDIKEGGGRGENRNIIACLIRCCRSIELTLL